MIFADKLINLRKKSGMSQEELAERINVSRQSVSKWEGAQSVPDLKKILALSEIFGVSTDYLLKDEIEACPDMPVIIENDMPALRKVTLAEASEFLALNEKNARASALAVLLCIVCPIPLIFLGALSDAAGVVGLIILLIIAASAVGIFIISDKFVESFKYLEKEEIDTEYGVSGMVGEKKNMCMKNCTRDNICGTVLCILSVIPILASFAVSEKDIVGAAGVCIFLFILSVGVYLIVRSDTIEEGFDKLLEEGRYCRENKIERNKVPDISKIYWLILTAVNILVCFITNDWGITWVIWAIGGVLYGVIAEIKKIIIK